LPITRCLLAIAIVTASAATSFAQDPGPLSNAAIDRLRSSATVREPIALVSELAKPVSFTPADCDRFVLVTKIKETKNLADLATIANCLNKRVNEPLQSAAEAPSSTETNGNIIQLRINYKRLKKWIPKNPVPEEGKTVPAREWMDAHNAELQAGRRLRAALKAHDLFATFSAVLVTGATLVDASQPEEDADEDSGTEAGEAETDKTKEADSSAQALGTIVWQSRHFGDESIYTFDWSIGGRIGVQPILNLVTSTPAEDVPAGENAPVTSAVHQNAFVWTAGVQMHKPLRGIDAEIGWYGSTGSSTLTSLPKAVENGQDSFIAFPLDYGANKTAWLWEAGMTFNIFDNPLEQIHAEKGTTTPQFQALVAVRRDERFRGGVYDDYDKPAGRLLFRLTLDAIRVLDRRQFGEPSKPFTFGFVVEHERSLASKGVRVPSATRFLLRGDINLLRALTGAPPADEKPEPPPTHEWAVPLPGTGMSTLAIKSGVKEVSVTLVSQTAGGATIKTTPPVTVTVTLDKPQAIAIPACPSANLKFTLKDSLLTLSAVDFSGCTVTAAVFNVTEAAQP
jgi:hypothetical protein